MSFVHCPICLDNFPLGIDKPKFVIYPCGHGCCTDCSDMVFSRASINCPTCRVTIRRKDGHPVYLEFQSLVCLIPLLSEIERRKQENDALRKELSTRNTNRDNDKVKAKKVEPPQLEVDKLGLSLGEARNNASRWQKKAAKLEQENKRYQTQVKWYSALLVATVIFIFAGVAYLSWKSWRDTRPTGRYQWVLSRMRCFTGV